MSGRPEIRVVAVDGGWAIEIDGERVGRFSTKAEALQTAVRALLKVEGEDLVTSGDSVAPSDEPSFTVH